MSDLDFLTKKEGQDRADFFEGIMAGLEQLTPEERAIVGWEMKREVTLEEAADRARVLIEIGRGTYKPLRREKPQEEEKP